MAKHIATYEEIRVRNWITSKRGVIAEVAIYCGVSHQYVQQVAYGRSTSLPGSKVELELRRRGWPGIRRKTDYTL